MVWGVKLIRFELPKRGVQQHGCRHCNVQAVGSALHRQLYQCIALCGIVRGQAGLLVAHEQECRRGKAIGTVIDGVTIKRCPDQFADSGAKPGKKIIAAGLPQMLAERIAGMLRTSKTSRVYELYNLPRVRGLAGRVRPASVGERKPGAFSCSGVAVLRQKLYGGIYVMLGIAALCGTGL